MTDIGQLKLLAFRPEHNSEGKRDVTGAFRPECTRFMQTVDGGHGHIVTIDNTKPMAQRKRQVLQALEQADEEREFFDGVAFFCHGWLDGIQLGFRRRDVKTLAAAIQKICEHSFTTVPLYCCSTGDDPEDDPITAAGTGDNSFADLLRDALCAQEAIYCRVLAHSTVAHTTKNPYALFFDGYGTTAGGAGGQAVVSPANKVLWAKWRRALRAKDSTFRFRFPFMELEEIHQELLDGQ